MRACVDVTAYLFVWCCSRPVLVGPSCGGARLRAISAASSASLGQATGPLKAGPLKASHDIGVLSSQTDGVAPIQHAPRSPNTILTRCRVNLPGPSHVTIRTGTLKNGQGCHIAAVGSGGEGTVHFPEPAGHIPSPPTSAKSSVSSANSRSSSRFRKMVLSCRDDRWMVTAPLFLEWHQCGQWMKMLRVHSKQT